LPVTASPVTELTVSVLPDTIGNYETPCSYFPAHPGTWWNYNTNGNEVKYEIDSVAHKVGDFYLPYFKNLDCYILGCSFFHSAYFGLGQSGHLSAPIIFETYNNEALQDISSVSFPNLFYHEYIGSPPSIRRELFAIDTSITTLTGQSFENVLIMKEFNITDSTHYYLDYFLNEIGLVKRDSVNLVDTTNLIEILTLTDYFINN